MSDPHVPDALLRSLTATQRRVVRLMAAGGWASGSPGATAVESTVDVLGMHGTWNGEQVRGEPRAFYPEGRGSDARWQELAARLDALPRRRAKPRRSAPVADTDPYALHAPDPEEINYAALTDEERRAITSLRRLAKRWPQSLRLVSMDGSLYVVGADDPRFYSNDGVERNASVITPISGIPNEGGGW